MSVIANKGGIEGPETKVLWNIPDYFSLPQKADSWIESPSFHFEGSTWCLKIFPNGNRNDQSVGFVGLYIRRNDPHNDMEITFEVSIVGNEGEEFGKHIFCYNFSKSLTAAVGWPNCVEREYLLQNKYTAAPGGILTVKFVGKKFSIKSTPGISDGFNGLVRDFQSLLTSEQKSDVVIKVKKRVFRAHKLILGARSTVFSAMFEHEKTKKTSGVVKIVDCDPDTFQDFLPFLHIHRKSKKFVFRQGYQTSFSCR